MTIIATRQEISLQTTFVYPPIPSRSNDWSAIDENTYDASYEGEDETGHHWSSSPAGTGETEAEAIEDLLNQLEAA
jgi:hypothetical protein